jgi:hypothetical protein
MNRIEEILHQMISEAWNNTHLLGTPQREEFQRLICNWTNSESGQGGNKARSMGVKKGVADWVYLKANGVTCWIELKTDDGSQSSEQKAFEKLCLSLGHEYQVCRDYYEFWKLCGIQCPMDMTNLKTWKSAGMKHFKPVK